MTQPTRSAKSLSRPDIEQRIPHGGAMCLLDHVEYWNHDDIECHAGLAADHPLKRDGRWPTTALVEFAAQAMAMHGALLAHPATEPTGDASSPAPRAPQGFIAGLRSIRFEDRWVPEHVKRLRIDVHRESGDDLQVLYSFNVGCVDRAGPQELASGRAIVVLDGARFCEKPAVGEKPVVDVKTALAERA